MKAALKKIGQYKNLIIVTVIAILVIRFLNLALSGYFLEMAHDREAIRNQIAIEKAETEKRVAIIKAEQEAEVIRVYMQFTDSDNEAEPVTYAGEGTCEGSPLTDGGGEEGQ